MNYNINHDMNHSLTHSSMHMQAQTQHFYPILPFLKESTCKKPKRNTKFWIKTMESNEFYLA